MDGRASQSIAGTHLNAWPPPVALLKLTSLFFLFFFQPLLAVLCTLSCSRRSLFIARRRRNRGSGCVFLSDKLRFIVLPRIAHDLIRLAHFPLSLIAASAAHSFDFNLLDLLSGLFFIDIPFALRAVSWLLFALLLASSIATCNFLGILFYCILRLSPFHYQVL